MRRNQALITRPAFRVLAGIVAGLAIAGTPVVVYLALRTGGTEGTLSAMVGSAALLGVALNFGSVAIRGRWLTW